MKTCNGILFVVTGVVLLIGGMFAMAPQALEPSELLTRMPPAAAPWLLAAGGLAGVLGLVGLIGAFPPHFLQTRLRRADRPTTGRERAAAGPARRLLPAHRGA